MSVSVTVHDIGPSSPIVANPLADLEHVRKTAHEKLRIRRLVQVRQQSKQLAAKVRQNYQQAKVKELAKIEQTKREEVKAWKRQHVRQLQDEYARTVCEVGEAHRAAEAAEECAVWFEEKRATQQAVALQRGKAAEENAARERERKKAVRDAKMRKKSYVPSRSIAVQASIPNVEPTAEEDPQSAVNAAPNDVSSSTDVTLSPFEQFRSIRKPLEHTMPETIQREAKDQIYGPGTTVGQGDKENDPCSGKDYSATAFTSPSDFRPIAEPQRRLQPFTQITELIQQRRHRQLDTDENRHQLPTQTISSGARCGVYGIQKTVQFDDMSDNTLSFPTSSVLTNDDRPFSTAPGSPRKIVPRKLVEQPKGHPVKVQEKELISTAKRGKVSLPESSSSTSYGTSAKVQYYDYNTRYRKEYDQPVGFVNREERKLDDPSAMEEANRYEKLQQELANARSNLADDRGKPALEKQQTRKDYEKLSKELDNLTKAGNKLKSLAVPIKAPPSEALIKQKAEIRQRKANEAIETLLQQRALITCPVVPSQTDRRTAPVARPSVVNVAEKPSHMRQSATAECMENRNKDASTDSCTSIVLGTFERPGIPLPTDELGPKDGGGMDKIEQLKKLLHQMQEQRQLLMEEIARETAEESSKKQQSDGANGNVATKQEIARLERMKQRQEELIEQQRLLQEREREVEELDRQLREKLSMLRLKKQAQDTVQMKTAKKDTQKAPKQQQQVQVETRGNKGAIDVDVIQPSSSTTSESTSGLDSYEAVQTRTGDAPVKIIIMVNDKGTPSKRKHKKKLLQKKRSPAKVGVEKIEEQLRQPPEMVVNPPPVRKEPIQVRKLKKGVPSKVMEISPGSTSTTSTVYRTLPPKIGSLKINNLLPQPQPAVDIQTRQSVPECTVGSGPKHLLQKTANKMNIAVGNKRAKGENLNPHLLKYIVRLLGMSRQSIDQLGVSSTSVSTPNASVVNVSTNAGTRSDVAPNEQEAERLDRLQRFIDENYNFLQEIDETLKRSDQSTLGSSDRSGTSAAGSSLINDVQLTDGDVSRVQDVWMKTLRRRERIKQKQQQETLHTTEKIVGNSQKKNDAMQKSTKGDVSGVQPLTDTRKRKNHSTVNEDVRLTTDQQSSSARQPVIVREGSLKSILKSPPRDASSKVAKIITPQGHVEVINLSDREEQKVLEHYSQLKECSNQRITELSEMINQVREETRRLVEDSLSSFEQQESTKYMDLPTTISAGGQPHKHATVAAPPVVEKDPCEGVVAASSGPPSNVPLGEDLVSEEIDNIFSSKQIGLSKDSGIAMSRPLTASDIRESPSEEGSQGREPLPFEPFFKDIPKPASIAVSGSHAGLKPLTQVASGSIRRAAPPIAITRYSPQMDEVPMHELSTIPEVDTSAVATSKVNEVSAQSLSVDNSNPAQQTLIEARNRLLLNDTVPDIGYDRFPKYEEYVRNTVGDVALVRVELEKTTEHTDKGELLRLDMTGDREPDRLQYRSYPLPAPPFDITEEANATLEPRPNGTDVAASKSSSDASLPDVVTELKKLNINLPFNNSLDNSNRSTPLSEAQENQPATMRPRPSHQGVRNDATEAQLNQLSESLAPDLEELSGLRWASSMLKRHQLGRKQQLEQHSSGSSPISLVEAKPNSSDATMENDISDTGKPPKLAEFISRQLMMRTHSDLLSGSSASSSQSSLHRVLLNMSHSNNSNTYSSPARELLLHTPTDAKSVHRTSTPVAVSKSTASGSSARLGVEDVTELATNRTDAVLFSGESQLSSVHWNSSSPSSSEMQLPEHRLTAPDVRLERQSVTNDRSGK
ncbi:uncharacterized protein LOC128720109 [Anopheles nili]|uniref:uncharacterized protein LOC128720109 n=1 Tax=Anopheles nili TaxID=185578 RepID=UPI00237C36D7|nr:uncharacterized protein LOC128720109 [Anopheles nili]